jgi:hypothetical protein
MTRRCVQRFEAAGIAGMGVGIVVGIAADTVAGSKASKQVIGKPVSIALRQTWIELEQESRKRLEYDSWNLKEGAL